MIDHPEYDRLVTGFMDRPDVDHWRILAAWCEEHGEWAGAFLWQRRIAYYPPIVTVCLKALSGDGQAIWTAPVGRYVFYARTSPKRLSYSLAIAPTLHLPIWWGKAKWHYWLHKRDTSAGATWNAMRLVNQIVTGEMKELAYFGMYSQPPADSQRRPATGLPTTHDANATETSDQ